MTDITSFTVTIQSVGFFLFHSIFVPIIFSFANTYYKEINDLPEQHILSVLSHSLHILNIHNLKATTISHVMCILASDIQLL